LPDDFEELIRINKEIAVAEDQGDVEALKRQLASTLAFRRANGTLVNRDEFLQAVKPSGPREMTIQSITLLGQHRALVTCVVSMPVNGRLTRFENARLFVRTADEWKLMGWANEPVSD